MTALDLVQNVSEVDVLKAVALSKAAMSPAELRALDATSQKKQATEESLHSFVE